MTTTVNYSWALPTVGASVNTWGTLVNNILTDIDAKMVSKTDAQTLTNKTLTAPVINGGASISGNVSASGTILSGSGASLLGQYPLGASVASGTFSQEAGGYYREYIGDGTGYTRTWSKRSSSTTIDLMALTDAGNLGIGVTPGAWQSDQKVIQLGVGAALFSHATIPTAVLTSNARFSAGAFYYLTTTSATKYEQYNGTHTWSVAPSGTAGNPITFTECGRFDASGNLLIGVSSNSYSAVCGTKPNNYAFGVYNYSPTAPCGMYISTSATGGGGGDLLVCTDASEMRFRVLGNGNCQNQNNSYGAISSIKYKENVVDTSPKLAKLLKIRVVNYNLIDDPDKLKQLGVIWEELNEISPGLCEETPDSEEVTLTREVERTVPVTIKKEATTERVQLDVVDGVAVQTVIEETSTIDEPVVDEYPVFDGDGNPVMEVVTPATEAEVDDKGNEVKPATPTVLRQKIHAVPRMETVVEKEEYTERQLTGTTTKSVKYSVFVPMLIKAMQEQQEQIEALKAKVGA